MAIDPQHLMSLRARGERCAYGPRDAMLYALGIGFGRRPGSAGDLAFVYEGGGPRVAPTWASAVARSGFLQGCGWNESLLVPACERLTLARPLPATASLVLDSAVVAVHDHGPDAGALVLVRSEARHAAGGEPVFEIERGIMARGDGGCGAALGNVPAAAVPPARLPDLSCDLDIHPELGWLYRLSGDMSPPHADPAVARRAGLPGPVLPNLCTLGVACRGILETICDHDPTLITGLEVRYTGDVCPGDRLRLELWQDANVVSFRARVPGREQVVLDAGRCVLAA